MSSTVTIIGMNDLFDGIDGFVASVEVGSEAAIAEVVDAVFDNSQAAVPYDATTKHPPNYLHLKDSASKEANGLTGSVSYRTNHPWYIEMGTTRMAAQPYLGPAFETGSKQLEQLCGDLLK